MSTPNDLFSAALQLSGSGWQVTETTFAGEPRTLHLRLAETGVTRAVCPQCQAPCPTYDHVEKRWRHLNFFQYRSELVARVPRVQCSTHGVKLSHVPWAHPDSGFTLLMEAFLLLLCRDMPVRAVAQLAGETDTRLWRLLHRHVAQTHAEADWREVTAVAVDETSKRRGKNYATVVLDAQTHAVLHLADGRNSAALEQFAQALTAHGGDPARVHTVSMDMLHCYTKGVRENLPQARVVFDRFHLMVMAGEAVDAVRRTLQRQGASLKGSLWALRGNAENLSPEHWARRQELWREHPELRLALSLRDALQIAYDAPAEEGPPALKVWCHWADGCNLAPFRKLAQTVRQYWAGIVHYFTQRQTQGPSEAVNGVIQMAKRRARGFRNFTYLRTIVYWLCGHLNTRMATL